MMRHGRQNIGQRALQSWIESSEEGSLQGPSFCYQASPGLENQRSYHNYVFLSPPLPRAGLGVGLCLSVPEKNPLRKFGCVLSASVFHLSTYDSWKKRSWRQFVALPNR